MSLYADLSFISSVRCNVYNANKEQYHIYIVAIIILHFVTYMAKNYFIIFNLYW
jgi:hypothetical protein